MAMFYPAVLALGALSILLAMAHISTLQSKKRKAELKLKAAKTAVVEALAAEDREPSLPNMRTQLTGALEALDIALRNLSAARFRASFKQEHERAKVDTEKTQA